jgi:hypothetical protein
MLPNTNARFAVVEIKRRRLAPNGGDVAEEADVGGERTVFLLYQKGRDFRIFQT